MRFNKRWYLLIGVLAGIIIFAIGCYRERYLHSVNFVVSWLLGLL